MSLKFISGWKIGYDDIIDLIKELFKDQLEQYVKMQLKKYPNNDEPISCQDFYPDAFFNKQDFPLKIIQYPVSCILGHEMSFELEEGKCYSIDDLLLKQKECEQVIEEAIQKYVFLKSLNSYRTFFFKDDEY